MKSIIQQYKEQFKDVLANGLSVGIGFVSISLALFMFWFLTTAWFIAWYAESYNRLADAFLWAILINVGLVGLVYLFRAKLKMAIANRLLQDVETEKQETEEPLEDDSMVKKLALAYFERGEEMNSSENLVPAETKAELVDTIFDLGVKIYHRYQSKQVENRKQPTARTIDIQNHKLLVNKLRKMEIDQVKSILQELIIRLQDAEKSFLVIKNAIHDPMLQSWMQVYSDERHKFHRELEEHVSELGGQAEVKTSILGDMHRLFINFKLNNISSDYDAVVNEIERGARVLISDYEAALSKISYPEEIVNTLTRQKLTVERELNELKRSNAFSKVR